MWERESGGDMKERREMGCETVRDAFEKER